MHHHCIFTLQKLLLACEDGEVDDVLALLTYGVNVVVEDQVYYLSCDTVGKFALESHDRILYPLQDMMTPLHVAATVGNLEILKVLVLEYNANKIK